MLAYIISACPMPRRLERHFTLAACRRAAVSAGSRTEISTAMMPITTSNSTSVNALRRPDACCVTRFMRCTSALADRPEPRLYRSAAPAPCDNPAQHEQARRAQGRLGDRYGEVRVVEVDRAAGRRVIQLDVHEHDLGSDRSEWGDAGRGEGRPCVGRVR